MLRKALNFASFYAGYLVCVLGAGAGLSVAATGLSAGLIVLHLWFAAERGREARLLSVAGVVGLGAETAHTAWGILEFSGTELALGEVPLWMPALWMLFASTLNSSLGWLAPRRILAAALGAVAGPFSYYAAIRVGAVELHPDLFYSLCVLAVTWTIATPALCALAARGRPAARAVDAGDLTRTRS